MLKKLRDLVFPSYSENRDFMAHHGYKYNLLTHIDYISYLGARDLPVVSLKKAANDTVSCLSEFVKNTVGAQAPDKGKSSDINDKLVKLAQYVETMNNVSGADFARPESTVEFSACGKEVSVHLAISPNEDSREAAIYTMRRD